MYVSEICAEGIFVTFPWWLKNVKSRSKIALFSNERHFEICFPKKRTITFFWSKLSKLHKKDPILHVATTISLKQGETKPSHGPIPHPLINQIIRFTLAESTYLTQLNNWILWAHLIGFPIFGITWTALWDLEWMSVLWRTINRYGRILILTKVLPIQP